MYYLFLFSCIGKIVDTVVMNPPFGTRKKGVDMDFLSVALKVKSSFGVYCCMLSNACE